VMGGRRRCRRRGRASNFWWAPATVHPRARRAAGRGARGRLERECEGRRGLGDAWVGSSAYGIHRLHAVLPSASLLESYTMRRVKGEGVNDITINNRLVYI
jgi:hypothetical protein